jgi:hypothetical protein
MAESYLFEDELKEFKERIKATYFLGEKYDAKLTHPGNISQYNPLDVILAFYTGRLERSSERLEKSSNRLNALTWGLIILTGILAVLTGITVWKLFFPTT